MNILYSGYQKCDISYILNSVVRVIWPLEKTEVTFMVKVRSKSGQMWSNFELDIFSSKGCSFDAARREEFNGGLRFPLSDLEQQKNQLWILDVITLKDFFRHNYATKWAIKLKFGMPIVNNELYDIYSVFFKTLTFLVFRLKIQSLIFVSFGVKLSKTLKSEIK